jgi:hypothetical protein
MVFSFLAMNSCCFGADSINVTSCGQVCQQTSPAIDVTMAAVSYGNSGIMKLAMGDFLAFARRLRFQLFLVRPGLGDCPGFFEALS